MCFISPKNVERKLENKEKKSNLNRGVTKLCFTAYRPPNGKYKAARNSLNYSGHFLYTG